MVWPVLCSSGSGVCPELWGLRVSLRWQSFAESASGSPAQVPQLYIRSVNRKQLSETTTPWTFIHFQMEWFLQLNTTKYFISSWNKIMTIDTQISTYLNKVFSDSLNQWKLHESTSSGESGSLISKETELNDIAIILITVHRNCHLEVNGLVRKLECWDLSQDSSDLGVSANWLVFI